ncbi:MAG: hypothetical protein ACKVQV_06960, partial [Bacteroidia bacterium]
MKNEMAQAFLRVVLQSEVEEDEEAQAFHEIRKYFQSMARYKYDAYQQYAPGMKFIERFALWLDQFNQEHRRTVLNFIKDRLVFISSDEMNSLVSSCFPDCIKQILIKDASLLSKKSSYEIKGITESIEYKKLLKQSLFFGLSDGAKTDVFRRANAGIIMHDQIYQTYEMSAGRAVKMKEDLHEELSMILGKNFPEDEGKFKNLFLLDDFSASGSSYLVEKEGQLKGKISQLFESIFGQKDGEKNKLHEIFDIENLNIHVILYLCTSQADRQITSYFEKLQKKYGKAPKMHHLHLIPDTFKVEGERDKIMLEICGNPKYYDPKIQDKHTGLDKNIHLGYKDCALPLVLAHNCPNNSLAMLWSYDELEFT